MPISRHSTLAEVAVPIIHRISLHLTEANFMNFVFCYELTHTQTLTWVTWLMMLQSIRFCLISNANRDFHLQQQVSKAFGV